MRRHDLIKKYLPTYLHTYPPTYLPTCVPPLQNTLKERSKRLVTFETFDQSDEETWPYQKIPTYLHTYPPTYLPTYVPPLENTQRSDPRDSWPERYLIRVTKQDKDNDKDKDILRTPPKSNPRDLWHLKHWLQFWQLRTWIHDNLCDLTINCDTGQHSQFLQCL